jgi:hypothetical protein
MTSLAIRTAAATVATTATATGSANNPVSTTYFWQPDQIPFAQTPALIVTSPDVDEHFTTLGAGRSEELVTVEIEYLDAPLSGDDLQTQMAEVELWFEQARANLRANPLGTISGTAHWAWINRMRTRIDKPLVDEGRVFYHGSLTVWLKANLH